MKETMKLQTKQITVTGIMLALCIISQFFKGFSVYVTGPIINLILIITTLYCGILCGTILSIITPITSFLITGSPVMSAIPLVMPCVMIGNEILVLTTGIITEKIKKVFALPVAVVIGSILKAAFMGLVIVKILLPTFGSALPAPAVTAASTTFSITQLYTALIGGALACAIWPTIKIATKNKNLTN